ncbi:transcriptional regulator-like protein [Stackebrandtia nassauensis DSM 44728]|uniref:Transcriptional regulator-like protein n=1 Tax=Stackebrandtia nassauensis (strain DSM 44728 / CIP 108903 / NRRL B-16338 / NBRC 102104 / LLR-40K-21) TaxID=446470 RepID=D3Q552_STANL|nr:transcriptional regulator-like protein [Stackebrandtia nassauensis DSM 44728]
MSVSRLRTERLVNLVICLLSTRRFLTADKIAATVPGYEHDSRDTRAHEAFQRKFERDKSELRRLGVPLETGTNSVFDSEPGYRIARHDYELPEFHLLPDEAAALGAAARLWQHSKLAADAGDGLWKLRAAGVDVRSDDEPEVAPVVTVDEAFSPVVSAVRHRREIRFDYLGKADDAAMKRKLQPWGVVCYRGKWYVVGHDLDRDAARCFRLSRISGKVAEHGPPDAYQVPGDLNLLDHVAAFHSDQPETPPRRATVLVAPGRAAGVRRQAEQISARRPDGDRLVIPYHDPHRLARRLAAYGPDVVVLEPDEVRKEMAVLLADVLGQYDSVTGGRA